MTASHASTLHLKLTIDGHELEAAVDLPVAPSPRRVLLPILRNLTDAVTSIAQAASPYPVSCKKGCDACCRQMVPISPAEAHGIAATLSEMPSEQSAPILARFDQALRQLEQSGLLNRLESRHHLTLEQAAILDRDYFLAAIPCPFLLDHACSIHPARPLACREFLVTSDPIHCADPSADRVRQLPLPAKVSVALADHDEARWLPLTLVRQYLAKNPEETPTAPPSEILTKILESL